MRYSDAKEHMRRITAVVLVLMMAIVFLMPLGVYGQRSQQPQQHQKVVRVGWYDSSFNTKDSSGRRSGYAYEYQMKIASYTGWEYEYVNGSWSDLIEMLRDGEIDLMSDVSYTEERAEEMLFPTLPMGTEEYYVFTSPGNDEISPDDYSTLNGKKVGVNKGSVQEQLFLDWEKKEGIQAELVKLTSSEPESLEKLGRGELDAYITPDAFADPEHLTPICKIGSSDFFFAVNKKRPDLLNDLNKAMSSIQDEDRFYNQEMSDKYIVRSGVNAFLPSEEKAWLAKHGTVRVGYQDNYMAFCAQDEDSGELTGALKDYLDYASGCLENAELHFDATAYPTAAAAMSALEKGEVDCVFPANLSSYDGETMHLAMTPPLMQTDIFAVVRSKDQDMFSKNDRVVVAVNEGNPNYDSFLLDHFPDWKVVVFPTTSDCLKAVANRIADCVLISNYRYNNISRECERYKLTTIGTGIGLDYCFAVNNGDTELYSILARITGLVPRSAINSALTYYITEDAKISFKDYILDNLNIAMAVTAVVLLIILLLLTRSMRAERKSKKLIAATETDNLTGLYNRDFFLAYAGRLNRDHPDWHMDAIVLNIEQFHSVNALNGREFGDQVLCTLGGEIQKIAKEYGGISGRFGADRFDMYCRDTKEEDFQMIFDRLQSKLDEISMNATIRLRMGVCEWQPGVEPVVLFDRARTACSMARGHYKEHLIVFDDKVQERELFEQRLLNDLRRAIDGYEFEVYYQPKYNIQEETPRLVSAEALVRWRHPELGQIAPNDFVPLFERFGKIGEVDRYVWSEAARKIVRWREMYGVTLPVSINLSRVDVFDPKLERTLDEILAANGLEHDTLKLEVTETAYTENADQVIRVVEGLRSKGYVVEMDDFGSGYSSLSMLSEMPIDVLKMDRAFIMNVEREEKNVQLVSLILDIAKTLDVQVIAEGVETESQLQLLRELGCTVAQGYYFSRPLSSTDFETLILQEETREEIREETER